MNTFQRIALVASTALLLVPAAANAGGPLANCDDGVPFLWPNGGQNIVWNADQGDLGDADEGRRRTHFVGNSFDAVAKRRAARRSASCRAPTCRSTSTKPTSCPSSTLPRPTG